MDDDARFQPDPPSDAGGSCYLRPARKCPVCANPLVLATDGRCRECGQKIAPRSRRRKRLPRFLSMPTMRYQNAYVWLVLVSALDIILTMLVLYLHGGHEVNPIADAVLEEMGLLGAIGFKFGTMLLAIVICEVVGRRNDRTGRRLSKIVVCINAFPVVYTFALLLRATLPPG